MKIDTEGVKSLKVIDVTRDKVNLIGTTYYWVGLTKDGPRKPLKRFVTRDGNIDEILLSTQVMKNGEYFQMKFKESTQRNS